LPISPPVGDQNVARAEVNEHRAVRLAGASAIAAVSLGKTAFGHV
jgi:hypothetical protein